MFLRTQCPRQNKQNPPGEDSACSYLSLRYLFSKNAQKYGNVYTLSAIPAFASASFIPHAVAMNLFTIQSQQRPAANHIISITYDRLVFLLQYKLWEDNGYFYTCIIPDIIQPPTAFASLISCHCSRSNLIPPMAKTGSSTLSQTCRKNSSPRGASPFLQSVV